MRPRYSQHPGGVGGHSLVGLEPFSLGQRLELLSYREPHHKVYRCGQRPVNVHTVAGVNQERLRQPGVLDELLERQDGSVLVRELLGLARLEVNTTVEVHEERPHLLDVIGFAGACFLERAEGVVGIETILIKVQRSVLKLLDGVIEFLDASALIERENAVGACGAKHSLQERRCIHSRHSTCWGAATR